MREVEFELGELLGVIFVGLIVEQAQLSPAGAQDNQEAIAVLVRQTLEYDIEVANVVDRQSRNIGEQFDFVLDDAEIATNIILVAREVNTC